jgi:hypothetical protein
LTVEGAFECIVKSASLTEHARCCCIPLVPVCGVLMGSGFAALEGGSMVIGGGALVKTAATGECS